MNTVRSVQKIVMLIATTCTLLLAACGGGGGNNNMSSSPPILSISVDPASIALGQSATITWDSSAGSSCTASGAWSGTVAASGTRVVTPTTLGTGTYTLDCVGSGVYGGNVTKSTTLTVTAPSAFSATVLVGDTAAAGPVHTDAHLVNPWGIAFGPATPVWVANNHSSTSTLYDGNGNVLPLVANLPSGAAEFEPTGIVFNSTTDFVVTSGTKSGAANFIFDGEGGMLAGWSQSVDFSNAITVYTATDEAVYLGLAIANNGSGNFLYAADFKNAKVDVFDATFTKQTPSSSSFAFTDPGLPAGYAPFGIQALKTGASGATQIYVSYARQGPPPDFDEVTGAGFGVVSVYDTNGQFIRQLVPVGGRLDAPWGITRAPAEFGTLSNALLIGNFGDGRINGYDVATGAYLGTVGDSAGNAFAVPGLWGIAFGNDALNQPHAALFYAAGTNDEVNGEYGRIDLGDSPPVLGDPPVVSITAPAAGDTVSGAVTVTASVADSIAIASVEMFANGSSIGVATSSPYSVPWDTTQVVDGNYSLTSVASDVNRNVATSAAVAVTVTNAIAATTLTQLQSSIFTPVCSAACHTGTPSATVDRLPGILNLTAGNSFAALVGVTSIEQPSLQRVVSGDATNSYIIHKLEGTPGISGSRMPFGGPFLDQATIDQVKSWINAGALNN